MDVVRGLHVLCQQFLRIFLLLQAAARGRQLGQLLSVAQALLAEVELGGDLIQGRQGQRQVLLPVRQVLLGGMCLGGEEGCSEEGEGERVVLGGRRGLIYSVKGAGRARVNAFVSKGPAGCEDVMQILLRDAKDSARYCCP